MFLEAVRLIAETVRVTDAMRLLGESLKGNVQAVRVLAEAV